MGYLLLATLTSALVSIVMRLGEKHTQNKMAMFMSNYAICSLLSMLFMVQGTMHCSLYTTGMGILNGILYLSALVFFNANLKYNGVVMSSTFMKLGVLLPTVMAVVVFKEKLSLTQFLGVLIAVVAIVLVNYEKTSVTDKNSRKSWLILLLFISGSTDAMLNIFDKTGVAAQKDIFLFITFFVACIFAFLAMLKEKNKPCYKDILCGVCIGIPNYFSSRFLLLALSKMDAVLVYPLYSVGVIVVITLVGILGFKESISFVKKIALVFIMVAIALLNV